MSETFPPSDGPLPDDAVGPELRDLFRLTTPREPSAVSWNRAREAVAGRLPPPRRWSRSAGWKWAAGFLVAVGLFSVLVSYREAGGPGPVGPDPAPFEFAALAMAEVDEVEIHSVRDGGWKAAVLGTGPIPDTIAWAGPKDVWLWTTLPDEIYGFEPLMSGGFQDMPVIWADDSTPGNR